MKKIILSISTGLLWSVVLLNAQNQPSIEEKLKDTVFLKELQAKMLEALLEDFKPSDKVLPDQKARIPVPSNITESNLNEMNSAFLNSFYLKPSPFNKDEMMIEFDNFFYPDARLVTTDTRWFKALDKAGKNYLKKDDPINESLNKSLEYNGGQTIKLTNENTASIIRVEGEVTIKAPLTFAKASFNKSDMNQTKSLDTFNVKLVRLENNFASIWVDGDYQSIQVYPYSIHGYILETNGSSSLLLSGHEKDLAPLHLPPDVKAGSLIYIKTNGSIDHIEVLAITKLVERKLKVVAIPQPVFTEGKAKLDRERYIAYAPVDFSTHSTPDTNLFSSKQNVKIIKNYSEWDKETKWSTQYKLPTQYPQTPYALPSFTNVTLLLKNKVVKSSEQEGFYDPESGILSMTPSDDNYKPLVYDEVRGTVSLKYPISMQTITVKKGEKKNGIIIDGNKLAINEGQLGNAREYLHGSNIEPIRVYGKGKWPLKRDNYYSSETKDDIQLYYQYFWGNISQVQIDQPTEFIETNMPFTVKYIEEKKITKPEIKTTKPASKQTIKKPAVKKN